MQRPRGQRKLGRPSPERGWSNFADDLKGAGKKEEKEKGKAGVEGLERGGKG